MSISIQTKTEGGQFHITLQGRLDHYALKSFCDTYESAPEQTELYVVDMERVSHVDSSGLGLLLLLHSHAGGDSHRVRLRNAKDNVRKVLKIAKYEDLFEIE